MAGASAVRRAAELGAQPRAILAAERTRLRDRGVPGELLLVGGSSVPAALTRGDVDLHLRVEPADFAGTVRRLRRWYAVVHPEIWSPTLATFTVPAVLPTGLAVTPAGSEHDLRFTRGWRLLAADPGLLAAYNALKAGYDGSDERGYEERKSAFFDRLVRLWPAHPDGGGRGPAPEEKDGPAPGP